MTQLTPETASSALQGKCVLICEDEGIVQMHLKRAVTLAGMQFAGAAYNGQDGVELALARQPDLVLMDISMPVMDGLEAARRILADFDTCIVVISAFSDENFQAQARQLGACGYLIKPISAATLAAELLRAWEVFQKRKAALEKQRHEPGVEA